MLPVYANTTPGADLRRVSLERSSRQDADIIRQMREYLSNPKRDKLAHIQELRHNWYFLQSAIFSVCQDRTIPKHALPYRVIAEYRRRFECQSQTDVLLSSQNRL